MNKRKGPAATQLGDLLALKAQDLRIQGAIDKELPLIKIDYRDQAAKAPFQFDIVKGTLHLSNCKCIPSSSESALYALWEIKHSDQKLACDKCRPVEGRGGNMEKNAGTDVLYGILSVLDQFGSVLKERGREYRESDRGKQTVASIDGLLSALNEGQKESLNLILASLENLIELVHQCDESITLQKDVDNKDENEGKVDRKA